MTATLAERLARKAAWKIPEWCDDTGIGRTKVYELIDAGQINSVKFGKSRLITTSPREFVASLAAE